MKSIRFLRSVVPTLCSSAAAVQAIPELQLDIIGGIDNAATGETASGHVHFKDFMVDTAHLKAGCSVPFDLYDEEVCKRRTHTFDVFAPFSHDAQSGTNQTLAHVANSSSSIALVASGQGAITLVRRRTFRS